MKTAKQSDLEPYLAEYRSELKTHAYRMLGSAFEAEDAVQEASLRAWRSYATFEGRSALRSWLYRITTNVCLDMLAGAKRRALPVDMGPAQAADPALLGEPLEESVWIEPMARASRSEDPAQVAEVRESIKLAFIAALQHLPPNQRAVLILREVLRWQATEVAELMDTTVASVNSALQRARASIEALGVGVEDKLAPVQETERDLLARYVDAFERYDMDALTSVLTDDVAWLMPPFKLWFRGPRNVRDWCLGPGIGCDGSRLTPLEVNDSPAFAQYKPDPERGGHEAWSIQVLELEGGMIKQITFFLDTQRLFPMMGLPLRLGT
jgi:RNA polymerase sigma-70 factor, ECF subfamily